MPTPQKDHKYHPFFCEENIWHLCAEDLDMEDPTVIIISNATRTVAVAEQRPGGEHGTVMWDYHVVLAGTRKDVWHVWDLDTKLPFPSAASEWLFQSFERFMDLPPELAPHFRVMPATVYREHLASDRSHMRDETGEWRSPPPPWDPPGDGHTLEDFIDMTQDKIGQSLNHMEFRSWLTE
jgi:protein N-terminal glutamine amidohydrolase